MKLQYGTVGRVSGEGMVPAGSITRLLGIPHTGSKTGTKLSSLYSILENSKPIKLELLLFHGVASDQSIEEN